MVTLYIYSNLTGLPLLFSSTLNYSLKKSSGRKVDLKVIKLFRCRFRVRTRWRNIRATDLCSILKPASSVLFQKQVTMK